MNAGRNSRAPRHRMVTGIARRLWHFVAAALLAATWPAPAQEAAGWQPLLVARFGNIDAIDAEDGDLAVFLRTIRNDGRFPPPMKTFVGPALRNPTFYGLVYEAWIECVVAAPTRPGGTRTVWLFPIENRDEYLTQISSYGLAEYEGMDGVTVLREMDAEGNVAVWHLEWLPGNVAVFGADRSAVSAIRRHYAENGASRGMLAGSGGRFMEPDLMLRIFPRTLIAWQDREPGRFWWRDRVDKLARDLKAHWEPGTARNRLIEDLADDLAGWPRRFARVDCGIWLSEEGLDWRMEAEGDFPAGAPWSQLEVMRRIPERAALAYGLPLNRAVLERFGRRAGRLLLTAAGGVVNPEAEKDVGTLMEALLAGSPGQAAAAWVAPPTASPELGAARLLVAEWGGSEALSTLWNLASAAAVPGSPVAQALSQIGWAVSLTRFPDVDGAVEIAIRPFGKPNAEPYYRSVVVHRQNGAWSALAAGAAPEDELARRAVAEYRAELAAAAVSPSAVAPSNVRQAFTRMGPDGASTLGFVEPVRFMQLALIEAADWTPRTPDQHEPVSAQLAREMLEYGATAGLTMEGEEEGSLWRFNGLVPWQSLSRLTAALGITESIGMD